MSSSETERQIEFLIEQLNDLAGQAEGWLANIREIESLMRERYEMETAMLKVNGGPANL